jgi:2-amino-4-hydroxy-6-hydroxymethyldihydropteridine diphosphokinase
VVTQPCSAEHSTLAIGLGANLPSAAGAPLDTLVAVRPQLHQLLLGWAGVACHLCWSPLFHTAPVGGPPDQPDYLNAALLVVAPRPPSAAKALELLVGLHRLEQAFGRERLERWGPRTLDLDLLWWGDLRCDRPELHLPHPRWHERGFVLAPLLAIERGWGGAISLPAGFAPLVELLAACAEPPPQRMVSSSMAW